MSEEDPTCRTPMPRFRMYYEDTDGFPLLLINGWGAITSNAHQLPAFVARFRLVVFDTGNGLTDSPGRTDAQMADDAASLLAASAPRAHVSAFRWRMIGRGCARQPERVDRLVLGCTGPEGTLFRRPRSDGGVRPREGEDRSGVRRILVLYNDACIRERPERSRGRRRRLDTYPPDRYSANCPRGVPRPSSRLEMKPGEKALITGNADRLVTG